MASENNWSVPPRDLELLSNEMHVWRVSTVVTSFQLKYLQSILFDDERQRALRFYFERDRMRFIVARGMLRLILSKYVDGAPNELHFCYNRYGKPALADMSGEDLPFFNMSHSGELVIFAVTRGREVGVDIETIRPFENAGQIVERFFSEREKAEFRMLPKELKNEAFFTCWTRKEAYVKALGKGISLPFDQFSVPVLPGEPGEWIHIQRDRRQENRWFLRDLPVDPGYVAAVAVKGQNLNFRQWRWSWYACRCPAGSS